MKKQYMKPEMQVVKMNAQDNLLVGSVMYYEVKQADYDEEFEDL